MGTRLRTTTAAACLLALTASALGSDEVEALRAEMQRMRADYERRLADLESRLDQRNAMGSSELERAVEHLTVHEHEHSSHAPRRTATPASGGVPGFRPSLHVLAVAGASDADSETLRELQGGAHDPGRRGFTLQAAELTLDANLGHGTEARATVVTFLDPADGDETVVELEEAWLGVPLPLAELRLRGGLFHTEFGRRNTRHAHDWDFVNAPIVSNRLLGPHGLRAPGAELSWRPSHDGPVELAVGLQNAEGEGMTPFLGAGEGHRHEDEDEAHGHATSFFGEPVDRDVRALSDLVRSARIAGDLVHTETGSFRVGGSLAHGPSGTSASGSTRLAGVDAAWTWRDTEHAGRRWTLAAEYVDRVSDYDAFTDEDGDAVGSGTLRDSGWYAQAVWSADSLWSVGLRHGRYSGNADLHAGELGLEDRARTSVAVTRRFPRWGEVRLQWDHDRSDALSGSIDSVWLQFEYSFGTGASHADHDHD